MAFQHRSEQTRRCRRRMGRGDNDAIGLVVIASVRRDRPARFLSRQGDDACPHMLDIAGRHMRSEASPDIVAERLAAGKEIALRRQRLRVIKGISRFSQPG